MHVRTGCLLLFVAVVLVVSYKLSQTYCPVDEQQPSSSPSHVQRENEEHAEEMIEEEVLTDDDDEENDGLSDDITFLFAIINMNRKAHLGIENYTFEADYLEQLKGFLRTFRPHKMQIIIQKKYYDYVKDDLYENVHVRFVETEELRSWKNYWAQETIRQSEWWIKRTAWLANVPQGYSDLYNPIVSHKILWLRDLSVLNPFKTRYFVWLDSGGICTPRLNPTSGMHLNEFKPKVKFYLDKVFLTVTPYALGNELHGCYREAMLKITHDVSPCYITKGWIMGGQRKGLERVASLYEWVMNKSLDLGCLGTEETLLTMCYYRRPDLFHVHHNIERLDGPFDHGGDVCHILWPGWPAQEKAELPGESAMRLEALMDQYDE
jgi:hypothetical protein